MDVKFYKKEKIHHILIDDRFEVVFDIKKNSIYLQYNNLSEEINDNNIFKFLNFLCISQNNIREELKDSPQFTLLIKKMITSLFLYCIKNKLEYWTELSLNWTEYIEVTILPENEFLSFVNDRNISQMLRHSVKKLYYKTKH